MRTADPRFSRRFFDVADKLAHPVATTASLRRISKLAVNYLIREMLRRLSLGHLVYIVLMVRG